MTWAQDHIPKYRLHTRSGRAVVTLRGRDVYLGEYGSPESKAEYRRLMAEFLAAGHEDPTPPPASSLTWCELAARYLRHAEGYYRTPDGSVSKTVMTIKCALSCLLPLYGEKPVDAFGPIALKAVRDTIIKAGKARKTVNDYVAVVKRIVKWGVGEELVPARIMEALRAVDGLKRGRSDARETAPVRPVPDPIVEATVRECSPVLATMIRLQRLTGMRPAEVCGISAAQIDMSGKVWLYKPTHHKLAHLGPAHERVVPLGPRAQDVLGPFLRPGDVNRPLFSPAESDDWRRERMRAERETPVTAAQDRRDAKRRAQAAKRKRRPGDRFDTQSYGKAIVSACRRAFASLPWRSTTLGSWLASRLTGSPQLKCLVASPFDGPIEPAAAGAALFAARADQGWPTYLDTLPQLKLLTIQRGEPEWLDILQDHDTKDEAPRYVPGDREWQRDPDLLGVSLAKDSKDARFDLVMEGHATVREAVARLPAAPKQRERVRLNVRMRPASGFARVRVVPEDPAFKLDRPVLLDFHAMTDTKKTPDEIRRSLPRGFPDVSKRAASSDRWREAVPCLSEFLRESQRKPAAPALVGMLRELRNCLGRKDNSRRDALGATAISSDGEPPALAGSARQLIDDVMNHLVGYLSHKSEDVRQLATVALGYGSCSHPALIKALRSCLAQPAARLQDTTIIAIGNCLREPVHVAEALNRFTEDLNADTAREDRLRAIAQMCRYRSDALASAPSPRCEDLMEALHHTIESEYGEALQFWRQTKQRKRLAIIFRESCRSVLFVLRRRRYDESFLNPTHALAKRLKESFAKVVSGIEQKKMEFMTGQVNQADTFNQISLYIDWKGSGVVNFGEE